MPAYAPPAQLAATPLTDAFRPKRPTVLSYGLGADSTAILLMYLADPTAHGLEPDLSDLIVVHAVTGERSNGKTPSPTVTGSSCPCCANAASGRSCARTPGLRPPLGRRG